MIILAINTASFSSQIALLDDRGVLGEKSWKSANNESEKLMPEINLLLSGNNLKVEDIDKIVVIKGPGPFTALRVSIALANALGYALGRPLIGIPLIDYWKKLNNDDFVLNAGGNRVFFKGEIIDFDKLVGTIDKGKEIAGEIKENQIAKLVENGVKWKDAKEFPSFGSVILDLAKNGFKGYDEKEFVEPLYFAAPHITKSSKSYK